MLRIKKKQSFNNIQWFGFYLLWLVLFIFIGCSASDEDTSASGNQGEDSSDDNTVDGDTGTSSDADADGDGDDDDDDTGDDDDDDNDNDDNDNDDNDTGGDEDSIDIDDDDDDDDEEDPDTDGETDTDADGGIDEDDPVEEVLTNPFYMVNHDPFSTFAADVDTASYDIFRRDVNNGTLPDYASVRLEEFVNYFPYNYEIPSDDSEHPFAINLAAAPAILDNGTTLLRASVRGSVPAEAEQKPANIVFLIDTSGSMSSSNKLPLVQRVLNSTLNLLDQGDKVAIVTYAGNSGVRLESTDASERDKISEVIYALNSGGSTNGEAGINLAYEQAEVGFIEEGINHVILCTDGDFNVGISDTDTLVSLIEEKRQTGISLTVLGFGEGNLNDDMMEQLSNAGDGTYSVITSKQHADDYVEKRMLSNFVQIAKDMKIQVEFNPLFVKAYRLLGYENRALADEDFIDDTVDAGEIGAGHRVTALYELVMVDGIIPDVDGAPEVVDGDPVEGEREIAAEDLALFKVRYKTPGSTETDPSLEMRTSMTPDAVATTVEEMDEDLKWAAAVAAFAEILKHSPYGDTAALETIDSIITGKDWLDLDRKEFSELFTAAKEMLTR